MSKVKRTFSMYAKNTCPGHQTAHPFALSAMINDLILGVMVLSSTKRTIWPFGSEVKLGYVHHHVSLPRMTSVVRFAL